MNMSTEHGPINVKAIYAESSAVTSSSGRIHIGHVHGENRVNRDEWSRFFPQRAFSLKTWSHLPC